MAFPGVYNPDVQRKGQAGEYEPVPFKFLSSMKQAVTTYGVTSYYVQAFLENFAEANTVIPLDWQTLAKAVLENSQYVQFKS